MLEQTNEVDFIREDPREVMQRLFKRKILFSIDGGGVPRWVYKMYEIIACIYLTLRLILELIPRSIKIVY